MNMNVMYSDTDFHSLSEEKQRRLINKNQVADSSGLLDQIPSERVPVRVFERPLKDLVFDRLESGRFTINELADEFGVSETDVRVLINKYRRRGRNSFTSESYKYNLLVERNSIIRVKGTGGREFQYSLETVPYIARIIDPTLTVSLLDITKKLKSLPTIIEDIPAGRATEVDETYALLLGDFWEIDSQVIFDDVTEYDRTYIETTMMPFPLLHSTDGEYRQVRDRFAQPDSVYKRYREVEQTVNEVVDGFLKIFEQGQPGIRMYQVVSIDLADLRHSAELQSPSLISTIDEKIDEIVSTLNPDTETVTFEDNDAPMGIEEAILTELDNGWRTSEEVYQELPLIVQTETSIQEVQKSLNQLSGLGVISKRDDKNPPRYCSETGDVNREDVL
jgi:hypothetical protein